MVTVARDSVPQLEYVTGPARTRKGWTNRDGEPLDTIEKLAAHLAAAEAAAVANGH